MFSHASSFEFEKSLVAPVGAVRVLQLPVLHAVRHRAPTNDKRRVVDGFDAATERMTVVERDDAAAVALQLVGVDADRHGPALVKRAIQRFLSQNLFYIAHTGCRVHAIHRQKALRVRIVLALPGRLGVVHIRGAHTPVRSEPFVRRVHITGRARVIDVIACHELLHAQFRGVVSLVNDGDSTGDGIHRHERPARRAQVLLVVHSSDDVPVPARRLSPRKLRHVRKFLSLARLVMPQSTSILCPLARAVLLPRPLSHPRLGFRADAFRRHTIHLAHAHFRRLRQVQSRGLGLPQHRRSMRPEV